MDNMIEVYYHALEWDSSYMELSLIIDGAIIDVYNTIDFPDASNPIYQIKAHKRYDLLEYYD